VIKIKSLKQIFVLCFAMICICAFRIDTHASLQDGFDFVFIPWGAYNARAQYVVTYNTGEVKELTSESMTGLRPIEYGDGIKIDWYVHNNSGNPKFVTNFKVRVEGFVTVNHWYKPEWTEIYNYEISQPINLISDSGSNIYFEFRSDIVDQGSQIIYDEGKNEPRDGLAIRTSGSTWSPEAKLYLLKIK